MEEEADKVAEPTPHYAELLLRWNFTKTGYVLRKM
jgi:hypothetical protein